MFSRYGRVVLQDSVLFRNRQVLYLTMIFIALAGMVVAGQAQVVQRGMATTGHNIANVDTPGYSKQRAVLATGLPQPDATGTVGSGVEQVTVQRIIDRFIGFAHEALDCGVLIVEHDMDLVRRLCPEIIVLESGRILAEGAPDAVLARKDVMDAYLGAEEEEA